MKLPIYLDYAATTPIDPRVVEKMLGYLTKDGIFGNSSSTHTYGRLALAAIEQAREQVAELINCDASEIIWTSGATEANNLALKGIAHFNQGKRRHIVTCQTEHESVLESCRQLEREGFSVTYLVPETNGKISLDKLTESLREDTLLVAIMQVNNEIGVIQDISAFGQLLHSKNIFFHVDAVQGAGKIPIDLKTMPVDLMSFSAHKVYGPKGIGALYIKQKPKVQLLAQQHGGGQERGLRSGTLATHQIVGMGEAFSIAKQGMNTEVERVQQLRKKLWDGLAMLGDISLNGSEDASVPGILNISFAGVDGAMLLPALKDLAVSTGSACHSATPEPSRVLKALGVSNALALGAVRFSFGRFTTDEEIDFAIKKVSQVVRVLREL